MSVIVITSINDIEFNHFTRWWTFLIFKERLRLTNREPCKHSPALHHHYRLYQYWSPRFLDKIIHRFICCLHLSSHRILHELRFEDDIFPLVQVLLSTWQILKEHWQNSRGQLCTEKREIVILARSAVRLKGESTDLPWTLAVSSRLETRLVDWDFMGKLKCSGWNWKEKKLIWTGANEKVKKAHRSDTIHSIRPFIDLFFGLFIGRLTRSSRSWVIRG